MRSSDPLGDWTYGTGSGTKAGLDTHVAIVYQGQLQAFEKTLDET
jgi:hypothetical protein